MNKKTLHFVRICIVLIALVFHHRSNAQCNTGTSICTPGVAGPFNFVTPGPPVSSCLDWIGPNTGYIMLHINSSGPLNMLIDGNASTGFLDVAVFNIPSGANPCTAIQSLSNEIGCNYASAASGCNQFGNAFACGSSVPAPNVVAGQDLMVVVENWSGSSSDFTLTVGPTPGAQVGPPSATITPAGPFCTSSAAVQLLASDMGGTWSGPGTSSTGTFNPATAGPGTHTINYSIGVAPCNSTSSTTIVVNSPAVLSILPVASTICAGQSVTLTASGAAAYSWLPGGEVTSAITVSPASTTTYTVTSPGCAGNATSTVNVNPIPTISVNSPSMCAGASATLTGTPGTGGGTFLWAPGGEVTPSISVNPASATTYTCSYTLSGCSQTSTGTVTVNPMPNVTSVAPVCSGVSPFNLVTDVAGGTWSGTGITDVVNGTFDPSSAASGNNVITYTAAGSCSDTIQIFVTPGGNAAWTSPGSICVLDPAVDLNTLITGTAGGTWSGAGVTGSMFDPAGLSGVIPVTYIVGTLPCSDTMTLNISITPNTPPTITSVPAQCSNVSPFDLSADISGGTWTGSAITNASSGTFDPSMASVGLNQVIYTIGGSCSGADTIQVTVNPVSNATWTLPSSLCSSNAPLNLDSLVTGDIGGTWTGTGVTGSSFDPSVSSGSIAVTYIVGATCPDTLTQNFTIIPASDPSWTTTSMCSTSSPLNLDSLVTGTSGGVWTGVGVSGNTFDPTGLSGSISVTYTVGASPCTSISTQNIGVFAPSNPSWTTTSMCSNDTLTNLDSLVTGTMGGVWTGIGVTGNSFDPTGLSGGISITYTVGPVGCQDTLTQNITVTPSANPAWTTTTVCEAATPINLNTLITGTSGGSWSGTGVTGNNFDPSGLSGTISVTYTVGSVPCVSTSTQNITVVPVASSAWTTTSMCENAGAINLDALITGTTGGTWSGTGVTGSSFDPNGLSGAIAVTYNVGTAPCASTSTQNITVTPNANATITSVSALCDNASSINLTAATAGGTWSGTGITNPATGTFNPSVATAGTYIITYSIAGACGDTDTVLVTVLPTPNSAWTMPANICENANSIDLTTLVTGTSGGTWSGFGVTGNTFDPSGLSGNTSITYTVSQNGCSSNSSQIVFVEVIDADFSASPTTGMAPVNVTTINNSTNAVFYSWNFDNGATSTATNPSTTYSSMGDYVITLTAMSANGCLDVAQVLIHVDELSALVLPNVFTPNGDGANDIFFPVIAEGLSEFKAAVYDRWGLKMFEWASEHEGWDGRTTSGAVASDGSYYYIVNAKGKDGKDYELTGFLQLIR